MLSHFFKPIKRAAWVILLLAIAALPLVAQNPASNVTAEPMGQANLRAWTDTTADLLGEIYAGTRYPVIGRSALYPWLLLGDPTTQQPIGWAFRDLLSINGDLNTVPVTEIPVTPGQSNPLSTPITTGTLSPAAVQTTPIPPTAVSNVRGIVQGEINIRYGPGVDYPRLGVADVGDVLEITGWHTTLPWVQINYPQSPTGTAWVNIDVITIEGDVYSLPATGQTSFNLPTLTPTPMQLEDPMVVGATPIPLSAEFQQLGGTLWSMMLAAGFDPVTNRLGSFFLMDAQTGEAITFGSDIAFSGMSVNKIAILAALYDQLVNPPDDQTAFTLGNAMICSENVSTNRLLSLLGDGNPYTGAEHVSDFLDRVGFQNTFIFTPFANDPYITPQAPLSRITDVDQTAAQPDPYNQMTVNEMGGLLYNMYQCSANGTGALINMGTFTQVECRQMLHLMNGNRIGALIEAGVPASVPISHKHGWIADTHGDAALVVSPGGAYVFVVVLHNPEWLEFSESELLIAQMSQMIYNYFNPDAPLAEIRYEDVPATCDIFGSPIIEDIQDPLFGES